MSSRRSRGEAVERSPLAKPAAIQAAWSAGSRDSPVRRGKPEQDVRRRGLHVTAGLPRESVFPPRCSSLEPYARASAFRRRGRRRRAASRFRTVAPRTRLLHRRFLHLRVLRRPNPNSQSITRERMGVNEDTRRGRPGDALHSRRADALPCLRVRLARPAVHCAGERRKTCR
jgi:hypothetical protein